MSQMPKEVLNSIEIPYLPISGFEQSVVCEKFAKIPDEKYQCQDLNISSDEENPLSPEEKEFSSTIALLLQGMGMEKYVELFQKEKVPLDIFLMLNDIDLEELGINNPEDRKIISTNLKIHQSKKKELELTENHADDLQIAKNVLCQLLLIQNYYAFVELHMKKYTFVNYKISSNESAGLYLKSFIEAADVQNKKITPLLFDKSHNDHLIGKLLKMYNLPTPESLQKQLTSSRRFWSSNVFKTLVITGFCSVILLIRKCVLGGK